MTKVKLTIKRKGASRKIEKIIEVDPEPYESITEVKNKAALIWLNEYINRDLHESQRYNYTSLEVAKSRIKNITIKAELL